MGQAFIKLGMWMQKVWCKFQCNWNSVLIKLMFKTDSCPNKMCTCKK